jgi:divalent metal cation (Fe/Co/Zn/Cd) transporter
MNKILSLAALAAGIILIVFGINSSNSIGSSFSRFFTGSPTDKSVWMLIVGVVLAVVGVASVFRRGES